MKTLLSISLYLSLFLSSAYAIADEWSLPRTVERIQANATDLYFYNSRGWGAAGCPNAEFLWVTQSNPAKDVMLSLALTAKTTNQTVKVSGNCHDSQHMVVNYLILE